MNQLSVMRLIMLNDDDSESGIIPSRSISTILLALADETVEYKNFWEIVGRIDPGLQKHFETNKDSSPILEGLGDGLLVISWEYHCIESFQGYQPLRPDGAARRHNGSCLVEDEPEITYSLGSRWKIIDHHFEESRH